MLQKKTLPISWGIGLSELQTQTLARYLEADTLVKQWTFDTVPSIQDLESDAPCIIWTSSSGLRSLLALPAAKVRHLELVPKALLLDKQYTLKDFEDATDCSIAEIVRPPLSKKRLRSIFLRAMEVQNVHHDILCMTREIMLEREILERKNELLSFLVTFFSTTTESLDVDNILQNVFDGLGILFATKSMHAALYDSADGMLPQVSLHTSAPENSDVGKKWIEELIAHSKKLIGNEFTISDIQQLVLHGQKEDFLKSLPSDGYMMSLPILLGKEKLGIVLLLTEVQRSLGRDQALALESAMAHLALSLKNANRFRMMQLQADYDVLTKVHNRRHFEHYIQEEIECFQRYEQPLSLVLVDIDNFKDINDTYGHQTGDIILRDVATLIAQTIRSSDYCARYGGEEFALLLPHTEQEDAHTLAERLRKKVAKHTFAVDGHKLHLTISLGISYLAGSMTKTRDQLVEEADTYLYQAKKEGKNCTRDYASQQQQTA